MPNDPWVGLAESITAVRAELQQAMAEGDGKDIQFAAGPVELEFSVDVRRDGEARAKVMVLPWSAEAKAGYAAGTVNRLKVTLQPINKQGRDAKISADSAERPK